MAELDHINVDGVLYNLTDANAYKIPNGGIPKADLAQEVKTSLGLADTALQPYTNFDPQTDTVWNKAQDLSSAQKQQARNNIGAGVVNTVTVNGRTFQSADGDVNLGTISGGDVNIIESISVNGATQPIRDKNVDITVPTEISDLSQDSTHRTVSDTEKTTWNGKQEALSSGENIKTINGQSLLGAGNITISGDSGGSGVQSDWNETDTTSEAYIRNKPNIPSVVSAQFSYDGNNEALTITPADSVVYDSVEESLTIL